AFTHRRAAPGPRHASLAWLSPLATAGRAARRPARAALARRARRVRRAAPAVSTRRATEAAPRCPAARRGVALRSLTRLELRYTRAGDHHQTGKSRPERPVA